MPVSDTEKATEQHGDAEHHEDGEHLGQLGPRGAAVLEQRQPAAGHPGLAGHVIDRWRIALAAGSPASRTRSRFPATPCLRWNRRGSGFTINPMGW